MLTIYKSSELYQEMIARYWQEETETEKYEVVKEIIAKLDINTEFAMLGASNPVMLRGRMPNNKSEIIRALDAIINSIGEERLEAYRANLRHL